MGLRGAPRMQVFPLLCTGYGKLIAFVTEVGAVQGILEYLGEPTTRRRGMGAYLAPYDVANAAPS